MAAGAKMGGLVQRVMATSRPHLNTALKYAKAEMTPPKLRDIPQITRGINEVLTSFRTGRWKQLTVKEAWLNILVTTEVAMWFFVGECIGKMHLVGYKI